MKRLFYGGLFIALIGLGMVGCKKENVRQNEVKNTPNEFGISTDGKMLIFKTLEDYENAVGGESDNRKDDLLQTINAFKFKNYFTTLTAKSDNENEMDDFFGQLLNSDGAIQIEDHIYKIDLPNEKVFVIEAKNKETDYKDLVIENSYNKKISVYSIDDDVLYAVKDGFTEKCGGIGGGEYVTSVVDFGKDVRCQGSVKHFRAGIYFRTTARFVPLLSGVLYTELEIKGPQAWAKKRPCGSGSVITSSSGIKKSGYTQQLWEFYSGARNLNGYYLFARVKCTFNGVTQYSTWAGRNINSPY